MPDRHWLDRIIDGPSLYDRLLERLARWAEVLKELIPREYRR